MSFRASSVWGFLVGLFLFLGTPSQAAAACAISVVQWGLTEVKTGQPVELRISGSDCVGKLADISIFKGAELIQAGLKATFDSTGQFAKGTYSFLRETVTASGGTSIQARFTARVNGEGQNTSVSSGQITVTLDAAPNSPGPSGKEVTFNFEIQNPLKINSFMELIAKITVWLTNIAIPIAVILIVYAGVLFLTAGAFPANVIRAKNLLKFVVIGLSIILIGRGFITLIESFLNLGSETPAPTVTVTATPAVTPTLTTIPVGGVGDDCFAPSDCTSPLVCGNPNICQRPSGNAKGEPCYGNGNCASGLSCLEANLTNQELGTCQ